MDDTLRVAEVREMFLRRLGLRIGPEMAAYVLRRMQAAAGPAELPVLGGDARTGVPLRRVVSLADLSANPPPAGGTSLAPGSSPAPA